MKCSSCGAIGSITKSNCQFCGSQMANPRPQTEKNILESESDKKNSPLLDQVQDSLNMIRDLGESPSSRFNIWAFLFPVAYLWGYGARENSKSIATVIIVPQIFIWLVSLFIIDFTTILSIGQLMWTIYVHFMVATRLEVLTMRDKEYSVVDGILAALVYLLILNFFSVQYFWN